ncbi:MAG: hypothetical protein MJZ24_07705 [Paludibacteraceae bacterium]|nr:hypothetical protein [Candidatus Physcocola equi]MCQ2234600.1 hypothetical protein [Paludibacteraceae bacterium]
MIKRLFVFLALFFSLSVSAQETDILDEGRVERGLQQISQANSNYFTNEGWSSTWMTLNAWYVDVLLNNQEAKAYLSQVINSKDVYDRFNDLNYKKQNKTIRYSEIDEFNSYLRKVIWAEIDRLYPPVQ